MDVVEIVTYTWIKILKSNKKIKQKYKVVLFRKMQTYMIILLFNKKKMYHVSSNTRISVYH